jgi:hypothetical protein
VGGGWPSSGKMWRKHFSSREVENPGNEGNFVHFRVQKASNRLNEPFGSVWIPFKLGGPTYVNISQFLVDLWLIFLKNKKVPLPCLRSSFEGPMKTCGFTNVL